MLKSNNLSSAVSSVTPLGVTLPTKISPSLTSAPTYTIQVRDTSLRVPHGAGGIVLDVKVFNREEGDDTLSPGVNQLVNMAYLLLERFLR
jgi:DNA-directed RNA polymerase subunit beta